MQSPYSRRNKSRRAIAEMNVVPYIDVMLVLLVIFMIATPLLTQGVKINLPQAQATPLDAKQTTPMIVSVDKDGLYYLNVSDNPEVPLSAQDLAVRVAAQLALDKQEGKQSLVMVKGDKHAVYQDVVNAMVLLQHAGVAQVGLMTTDPNTTG